MGVLIFLLLLSMSVRIGMNKDGVYAPEHTPNLPFIGRRLEYDFTTSAAPFLTMLTVVEPRHRGELRVITMNEGIALIAYSFSALLSCDSRALSVWRGTAMGAGIIMLRAQ
jgi:hypothetical protein